MIPNREAMPTLWSRFNVVSVGSLRQEFPTTDATLYLGINEHIESALHAIE